MDKQMKSWKIAYSSKVKNDLQKNVDYQLLCVELQNNENIDLNIYNKFYRTQAKPVNHKKKSASAPPPLLCYSLCPDFTCTKNHERIDISQEINCLATEFKSIAETKVK